MADSGNPKNPYGVGTRAGHGIQEKKRKKKKSRIGSDGRAKTEKRWNKPGRWNVMRVGARVGRTKTVSRVGWPPHGGKRGAHAIIIRNLADVDITLRRHNRKPWPPRGEK